jgi:polar amino acid transport system substrate-binding protein
MRAMKRLIGLLAVTPVFLAAFCTGCSPAASDPQAVVVEARPGAGSAGTQSVVPAPGNGETRFDGVDRFPDIKAIVDRGVLRVGICDTNFPFVIRAPGGGIAGGLDIEIVTGLARHLGVKPQFDLASAGYGDLFRRLHKGEFDLAVGGLSHTFDRGQYVYFSRTYVRLNQCLIMSRTELSRRHIEDNPFDYVRKTPCAIGVMAGSSYVEFARDHFPQATLREYGAWREVFAGLKRGEVLAALDDNNVVALIARKHPEIALDVMVYILTNIRDNIGIAVSPDNPNLLDCVNLYLETHDLNLDINALMKRYPDVYRCD